MTWHTISDPASSIPSSFGGDAMNKISNMFNGLDIGDNVVLNEDIKWTFPVTTLNIVDPSDATKELEFDLSGISTSTKIVVTIPDQNIVMADTLVGLHDIFIPAEHMSPAQTGGCSTLQRIETATNKIDYDVLDFDPSTNESAIFNWTPPRNYDGQEIRFMVHWIPSPGVAAETVIWGLSILAVGDEDAIDAAYGTEVTQSDAVSVLSALHKSSESSDVTPSNMGKNTSLFFKLTRKATTDTSIHDARLVGVTIVYGLDASRAVF